MRAHVEANRTAVHERLARVREVISDGSGPLTAFEAVPLVYGQPVTPMTANWWLSETLTYLVHLEREGVARRVPGRPERWTTL